MTAQTVSACCEYSPERLISFLLAPFFISSFSLRKFSRRTRAVSRGAQSLSLPLAPVSCTQRQLFFFQCHPFCSVSSRSVPSVPHICAFAPFLSVSPHAVGVDFLFRRRTAGVRCRSQRRQQTQEVAAETKPTETRKKWDGNSWPAENERRKAVPADTKDWEMENTHVEVRFLLHPTLFPPVC